MFPSTSQSILPSSPQTPFNNAFSDLSLTLEVSPSKALAHQKTTTAWSRITAWLASVFSPEPVPPFERNTATLTYLESLMDANVRADHRQRLLHEARLEQLDSYEEYEAATQQSPERGLLRDVKAVLSPETRQQLEEMAKTCVVLGCMPPPHSTFEAVEDDVTTVIGRRIVELTRKLFRMQNEVEELTLLNQKFDDERDRTEEDTSKLREPETSIEDGRLDLAFAKPGSGFSLAEVPLDTLLAQTSQFSTSTKQLILKIKEYQSRADGLDRALQAQRQGEGDITIEDARHRETMVQHKREELKKLEGRLREFNGLPPDLEASREEVRRAQGELEEWRRRREAAFEMIGGG